MIGQNGFDITTKAVINGSAFDLYEAQEVEGSFQIDSTVALDRPVSLGKNGWAIQANQALRSRNFLRKNGGLCETTIHKRARPTRPAATFL